MKIRPCGASEQNGKSDTCPDCGREFDRHTPYPLHFAALGGKVHDRTDGEVPGTYREMITKNVMAANA